MEALGELKIGSWGNGGLEVKTSMLDMMLRPVNAEEDFKLVQSDDRWLNRWTVNVDPAHDVQFPPRIGGVHWRFPGTGLCFARLRLNARGWLVPRTIRHFALVGLIQGIHVPRDAAILMCLVAAEGLLSRGWDNSIFGTGKVDMYLPETA